jgi:hypothetical protein
VTVTDANAAKLAEALSGRAGADGLRWVLQGAPLRRVLRQELRRLLTEPGLLGACRLQRAKFRPGHKLSAYYEVGLRSQSASRQVAVTWTVAAGEEARRDDGPTAAMEAAALGAGLATPFQGLEGELPALGMRLLVWPLDPSHPQLLRMSDPRHVHEMLAERLRPAPGYGVRAVRYRPGQRHVLRYDPLGDGRALFAKLYLDGEAARAFGVAEWIAARLPRSDDGLSAARPIAHLPEQDVVLYGEAVGEPLTRRLGEPSATLGRCLALAGAALRRLHDTPSPTGELQPPTYDLRRELRSTSRAARRLGPMLPTVGGRLAALIERACVLDERLPREAPALAHGDYKADHLWIAPRGSGVTLIDFDSCSLSEPARDLGNFLADLQWWYAQRGAQALAWAQQRFLEGYAAAGDPPSERLRRARLYEAVALSRITAHRVRVFDRDWASRTEALTARAAEILTARGG